MKKTILAMAVPALLAAGSASASINLYDAEGVKVDLSGAAEVQYFENIGEEYKGQWRLDDGDIAVNTEVAISPDMSAVAGMSFEFDDGEGIDGSTNGNVENKELFVGFKGDNFGQITFGRQYLISDDIGITKDYELSVVSFGTEETNHGDQVAKYVYDNGTFYAGTSAYMKSDGKDATSDELTVFDARLGYRIADFDVRGYYYKADDGNVKLDNKDTKVDVTGYQFEVEYAGIENVGLAASYGNVQADEIGGANDVVDTDAFSLAADYTMGKTTFGAGWDRNDPEGGETVNGYYANVTYALHSNAKVYAEIGDTNADNSDVGYVAGMEVKF
jgi:Outer membrane protein (porin)